MVPTYLVLFLLVWGVPGNAESEEKRTTVTSHTVTTDPMPPSNNNADRRPNTNVWDGRSEWQKGWHDSWPLDYESNRPEWRNQPHTNYGQASTDNRGYNQHGEPPEHGYSNVYGYGYNRYPYPPYNDKYSNPYGGYGNYGGYGYYGQRPGQVLYDHNSRRGGYRPKASYGQPYYGYDKTWSNGRYS